MPPEAVRFERPLRDVRLAGRHASAEDRARERAAEQARQTAEIAAAREAGYRQGRTEADAAFAGQLMAQRQEVAELADGILRRLGEQETLLAAQARGCVPGLVMNIVRRVLAGAVPDAGRIEQIIEQALTEAPTDKDQSLEVSLSPGDLARLEGMAGDGLRARHPRLLLRADAALSQDDCLVRGGFGLIDARMETKLKGIAQLLATS